MSATAKHRCARTFRVFEAGVGENPAGLFRKASSARGSRRAFTGVERLRIRHDPRFGSDWFDLLGVALRQAGLREIPRNVKFIDNADAAREIAGVPKGSQGVVFSSYLLNNLQQKPGMLFLQRAKEALRPGGRIVIVQDKNDRAICESLAEILGMDFYAKEIPDEVAVKSDAEDIKGRASPEKRKMILLARIKRANAQPPAPGELEKAQEMLRPTIYSFKKRRKNSGGNAPKKQI